MRDRILINKALIPYTFDIVLGNTRYVIEVNYNTTADMFTLALYKDNILLCSGEPLIYGKALFEDVFNKDFPALTIIPVDEAGNNSAVTYSNLGNTVFLCIYDGEDDDIPCGEDTTGKVTELTEEELDGEYVLNSAKAAMEKIIESMGGTVTKEALTAMFEELAEGIETIPTGGGDSDCCIVAECYGVTAEAVVDDDEIVGTFEVVEDE